MHQNSLNNLTHHHTVQRTEASALSLGKVFHTQNWGDVEVIDYVDSSHITIKFLQSGTIRANISIGNLRKGKISDIQSRSNYKKVFGVGIGPRQHYDRLIYRLWTDMLARCYDTKRTEKRDQSYRQCVVCEEWLDYYNFEKWYQDNAIDGIELFVDKDILGQGCKMYSPDTCCLVPREINNTFQCKKSQRDLPHGVTFNKSATKRPYVAQVGRGHDKNYCGSFATVEEAHMAYQTIKKQRICDLAYKYKSVIRNDVFQAMLNYQVK